MNKENNIDYIKELERKSKHTIENFQESLNGINTGRASSNLLNGIIVETSDLGKSKINHIASISIGSKQSLSVMPWNKDHAKAISDSIVQNLQFSCIVSDGKITVSVPSLTLETRKNLKTFASKCSENTKIAVRNIRKDLLRNLKKELDDKNISEDEHSKIKNNVDKNVKDIEGKINDMLSIKIKEIEID
ncbi:MAG: ribosome recycling factor [Anaplasmataceae bacterium]|nr:ribosome recycling factor [Anaplasmataceae bacterium]